MWVIISDISSDIEIHENSCNFEQNTKADDSCKIKIDFGDLDVRMAETPARVTTAQLDCIKNVVRPKIVISPEYVVEASWQLEQQPIVENEPTSIQQLHGRSIINLPHRYGAPVALIADV